MKAFLTKFWYDDLGQDLLEYALVVAMIALAAAATMRSVAEPINRAFEGVNATIRAKIP